MATNKKYTVEYRRKRQGKTDYKQRLLLIKSRQPRLVIRKTLRHLQLQIIEYSQKGDSVKASAHTAELRNFGWKGATANTSSAYLCGVLIAKKAKDNKITSCISDIGKYTSVKGAVLYAAIKGAIDAGLNVPCSPAVFPDENRINGSHIAQLAGELKKTNKEKYEKIFSKCIKNGLAPEDITKHFEETLKKMQEKNEAGKKTKNTKQAA